MSDENNNDRNAGPGGRQPLTLKPRVGGSVSSGTVKQSFSHGRTKTVVVETKRARPHGAPAGNLAAPSNAERRVFEPPKPTPTPAQRPAGPGDGLSADERAARQRVIEAARAQQSRQEADRQAQEARARARSRPNPRRRPGSGRRCGPDPGSRAAGVCAAAACAGRARSSGPDTVLSAVA